MEEKNSNSKKKPSWEDTEKTTHLVMLLNTISYTSGFIVDTEILFYLTDYYFIPLAQK